MSNGFGGSEYRSYGRVGAACLVLLLIVVLTACSTEDTTRGVTEADFSNSPTQYLAEMDQGDPLPVDQSETVIGELGNGGIAGQVYAADSSGGEVDSTWYVALAGSRNELNAVELKAARSLGLGADADEWNGNEHFADSGWHFQHQKGQIAGLEVDEMSMVDSDGAPIESWLIARPRTDLLLGIRTYDSDLSDAKQALAEMIDDGQRNVK